MILLYILMLSFMFSLKIMYLLKSTKYQKSHCTKSLLCCKNCKRNLGWDSHNMCVCVGGCVYVKVTCLKFSVTALCLCVEGPFPLLGHVLDEIEAEEEETWL